MKCIQYIETELIKRVKNGIADEAVKKGEALYVSKQAWKEKTRDAGSQDKGPNKGPKKVRKGKASNRSLKGLPEVAGE